VVWAGVGGVDHAPRPGGPEKRLRRAAQRQLGALEEEIGFDIKVIKGAVRQPAITPAQDAEMLHAQLVALRSLSHHLVVIFDEFHRLRHCSGDPLAIIRSALMSSGANHISLLFTGSIRNALQMMLESSDQPIFGEAARMQLPAIERADFFEYLDFQFEATGKPADDDALNYLLNATRAHPRSTEQLAWQYWADTPSGQPVKLEIATDAHDKLVRTIERSEFASVLNTLMSGDESEVNEVRGLQLLADAAATTSPAARSSPLRLLQPFTRPHLARPATAPRARRSARRRVVHRRSAVQRMAATSIAARAVTPGGVVSPPTHRRGARG
jgi:hypothetical protein